MLATLFTAFLVTIAVQALMMLSVMRESPDTFAQEFDFPGIAVSFPLNLLVYCIVVLLIVSIHRKALSFCEGMFSKEKREQRLIDRIRRGARPKPDGDGLKPAP